MLLLRRTILEIFSENFKIINSCCKNGHRFWNGKMADATQMQQNMMHHLGVWDRTSAARTEKEKTPRTEDDIAYFQKVLVVICKRFLGGSKDTAKDWIGTNISVLET